MQKVCKCISEVICCIVQSQQPCVDVVVVGLLLAGPSWSLKIAQGCGVGGGVVDENVAGHLLWS